MIFKACQGVCQEFFWLHNQPPPKIPNAPFQSLYEQEGSSVVSLFYSSCIEMSSCSSSLRFRQRDSF